MNLTFEKLTEENLEEVALLYDAERPMKTNREKMKKTFAKIKENADYYMIVVKQEKEVIGFVKAIIHHDIFEENNPFMTLWSLRVKKEWRNQKIATKMFAYVEKLAKELNCEFICLIAEKENVAANHLYKSLGYSLENGYVKILK